MCSSRVPREANCGHWETRARIAESRQVFAGMRKKSFLSARSVESAVIRSRGRLRRARLLYATGTISLVFGVLVIAWPGAGVLALVWMISAHAIFSGALLQMLTGLIRTRSAAWAAGTVVRRFESHLVSAAHSTQSTTATRAQGGRDKADRDQVTRESRKASPRGM